MGHVFGMNRNDDDISSNIGIKARLLFMDCANYRRDLNYLGLVVKCINTLQSLMMCLGHLVVNLTYSKYFVGGRHHLQLDIVLNARMTASTHTLHTYVLLTDPDVS